ncbi:MAG: hypothetical protein ACJAZ3_002113, partial [Sphingobacteriales bacterium]
EWFTKTALRYIPILLRRSGIIIRMTVFICGIGFKNKTGARLFSSIL